MNRMLLLAWRYVAYHKIKSAILTICLTLTIVLPLTAHLLIAHYNTSLTARGDATPLVVGARGNRFDLVLTVVDGMGAPTTLVTTAQPATLRVQVAHRFWFEPVHWHPMTASCDSCSLASGLVSGGSAPPRGRTPVPRS